MPFCAEANANTYRNIFSYVFIECARIAREDVCGVSYMYIMRKRACVSPVSMCVVGKWHKAKFGHKREQRFRFLRPCSEIPSITHTHTHTVGLESMA